MKFFPLLLFALVIHSHSMAQIIPPINQKKYCIDLSEITDNMGYNTQLHLSQWKEPDLVADSKVFRFGEIRPFGLDAGQAFYKIESTETHCEVSIKIVQKPKRKQEKPTKIVLYVWTYDHTVWTAFEKLADSTFLNLDPNRRLGAVGVHDGSSVFYEYKNLEKYNSITRSTLVTEGTELQLQKFIKNLIGPMYESDCE